MRQPKGFRQAIGITHSEISPVGPHFVKPVRLTGKLKAGLDYEAEVHSHFTQLYGDAYTGGPWLKFIGKSEKMRWCQPDGWLIDLQRNRITVIECKYKHISRSWWQLHRLYLPVIQHLFGPEWEYCVVEVSKWCDPATPYPGETKRIRSVEHCYGYPVTNLLTFRGK